MFPFEQKILGEAEEEEEKRKKEREEKEKEKEIEMKWIPAIRHSIPEPKGTHVFIQVFRGKGKLINEYQWATGILLSV